MLFLCFFIYSNNFYSNEKTEAETFNALTGENNFLARKGVYSSIDNKYSPHQVDSSIILFEKILASKKIDLEEVDSIEIFKYLAKAYYISDEREKYGLTIEKLNNYFSKITPDKTAEALLFISNAVKYFGDLNEFSRINRKILNVSNIKNINYKLEAKVNIASVMSVNFEQDSAIVYLNEVIESRSVSDFVLGRAYAELGSVYERLNDKEKSYYYRYKAVKIFKALNDDINTGGNLSNIANLHKNEGNYFEAVKLFSEAEEFVNKTQNTRLLAIISNNLANIYVLTYQLDKALVYYEKAASFFKDLDKKFYGVTLINIISIHNQNGEIDKAFDLLNEASEIFLEIGAINEYLNVLIAKGYHFGYKDDIEMSRYYFQKAIDENINRNKDIDAESYIALSGIDINTKNFKQAEKNALKAEKILSGIERKNLSLSLYQNLYKIKKQQKDNVKALAYLEKYNVLKEELFDDEKSREFGRLEAEIEFKNEREKVELENNNKLLKKELEIKSKEKILKNQKNYLILLVFILSLLVVIIFILYRLQKERKKNHALLLNSKKKLEKTNLALAEINEQKNRLFSIIAHDLRGPLSNLRWFLSMLMKDKLDESDTKMLISQLNKDLIGTLALTENLLDWAEKSMKKVSINKEKISLYKTVENIKELYNKVLKDKNITFKNTVENDIHVYIDKNVLSLLLRNLISNAIKYCKSGDEIIISHEIKDDSDLVIIKDTGIGMDERTANRLFFDKINMSQQGTNNEKGSGIGLMLCKNFIVENDGNIWVEETEIGKGTTIIFSIPVSTL